MRYGRDGPTVRGLLHVSGAHPKKGLWFVGEHVEEACFVLPTARCPGKKGVNRCGRHGLSSCISSGPCVAPDSRSRVFVQGLQVALDFVKASVLLGSASLVAGLLACCFCCELHTGRSMCEHAQDLWTDESSARRANDEFDELGTDIEEEKKIDNVRDNSVYAPLSVHSRPPHVDSRLRSG